MSEAALRSLSGLQTLDYVVVPLADGALVVSNEKSGTTLDAFGQVFHQRDRTFDIGPDGFAIETEISTDGGKTWFVATKYRYRRAAAGG